MAATLPRAANNSRIGTCPHGPPMGACPICNGMGGGGSVKKDNKPKEMTWNECYAIGQMLKAQKEARLHTQQMFAAQTQQAHLNNLQTQINALKLAILNSSLPKPVAQALTAVLDTVIAPMAKAVQTINNTIQNLTNNIAKAVDSFKQKIADITDKLTAMLGEAKAAIEKKISDKLKDMKKKLFGLFGIAQADNEEDEEVKRIEEQKLIHEENTTKETLFQNKKIPEQTVTKQESED